MILDPVITLTVALLLSYIFVTAALHKWQDRPQFIETLKNYRLLPERSLPLLLWFIPALELITGITLLLPRFAASAALCALALLGVYTLAITINLLRGRRNIDCGCGSPDQKQAISEWLLLRNGVLIFFAWLLLNPVADRALFWFDWTVIIPATVTACLFYNIVNRLLVNRGLLQTLRSQHG
ncbi:MAG: MauE/DoxX family redox-associated membrane protein [Gammaproteobacteria bacterium]